MARIDASEIDRTRGIPAGYWRVVPKFTPDAARLADRHYSRRKIGSPQFMPPGQTLVLLGMMSDAVWGWWRPHPDSGLQAMNGLDGWTCTIFRNDGEGENRQQSSNLVLQAEIALASLHTCGPDGMLTYVWDAKVRSCGKNGYRKPRPGHCFKMAGWQPIGHSADKKKTLLWKPFELAGIAACGIRY